MVEMEWAKARWTCKHNKPCTRWMWHGLAVSTLIAGDYFFIFQPLYLITLHKWRKITTKMTITMTFIDIFFFNDDEDDVQTSGNIYIGITNGHSLSIIMPTLGSNVSSYCFNGQCRRLHRILRCKLWRIQIQVSSQTGGTSFLFFLFARVHE